MEIWSPVPGKFSRRYSVSNFGRVKSHRRTGDKILKPVSNGTGYLFVGLYISRNHLRYVHRLVCEAFLGPSHLQVNHLDGNKSNNRLDNLEYVTAKQNSAHAIKSKLYVSGERSPLAKLTQRQVDQIRIQYQKEKSINALASVYGVTYQNIKAIVDGKTWR